LPDQLFMTLSRWREPLPGTCSHAVPNRTRMSLWICDRNERSPIVRSDIVPGGVFPDYEPPDHTGKVRKLSELQGDDPLILTLPRGHYCPKEHQQHLELAAFMGEPGRRPIHKEPGSRSHTVCRKEIKTYEPTHQNLSRRLEHANATRNYHQGLLGSLLKCKNQQSRRFLS